MEEEDADFQGFDIDDEIFGEEEIQCTISGFVCFVIMNFVIKKQSFESFIKGFVFEKRLFGACLLLSALSMKRPH